MILAPEEHECFKKERKKEGKRGEKGKKILPGDHNDDLTKEEPEKVLRKWCYMYRKKNVYKYI